MYWLASLGRTYAHPNGARGQLELWRGLLRILTHAVYGRRFVQPFPAHGAEAPLVMRGLRPAVRHRVLDDAWRNARAGRHHVRHAALVHDEVAYCVCV